MTPGKRRAYDKALSYANEWLHRNYGVRWDELARQVDLSSYVSEEMSEYELKQQAVLAAREKASAVRGRL